MGTNKVAPDGEEEQMSFRDSCTRRSFRILVFVNLILFFMSFLGTLMIGLKIKPAAAAKFQAKAGASDEQMDDIMDQLDYPKGFLYAGLVFTLFVLVLSCSGCFGAWIMKGKAAEAKKGEFNDEELNKKSSKSKLLLFYIILLSIMMILEFAMGMVANKQKSVLTDAALAEIHSKEEAGDFQQWFDLTKKVLDSDNKKTQESWEYAQDRMECCGFWWARDSKEGSIANYGEFCCSDISTWKDANETAGDDALPTCGAGWLEPKADRKDYISCNTEMFLTMQDNAKNMALFCILVFVVQIICLMSALQLRFCSVKKGEVPMTSI